MKILRNAIKSDIFLKWMLILSGVLFILTGLYTIFSFPPLNDEKDFHLPTLLSFYYQNPFSAIISDDYNAANTPLPYLMARMIFFFSPPGIIEVRLLSLVFAIGSILLLLNISGKISNKNEGFYFLPVIVFYPYFIKSSFSFFMAVYGLFWFLLSLSFLLKKLKNNLDYFLTGFFAIMAVLCQQFYFAVFAASLFQILICERPIKIQNIFLFCLPVILPLILFWFWGGWVHPIKRHHHIGFITSNLTSILTISGFYLLPLLAGSLKKISGKDWGLSVFTGIMLIYFARPHFSSDLEVGNITGFVHRIVSFGDVFIPNGNLIINLILVVSGLLGIKIFLFRNDQLRVFYNTGTVLFIAGFAFDALISERHLIPLVVMFFLGLISFDFRKTLLKLWGLVYIIMGTGYTFYWFFSQSGQFSFP